MNNFHLSKMIYSTDDTRYKSNNSAWEINQNTAAIAEEMTGLIKNYMDDTS